MRNLIRNYRIRLNEWWWKILRQYRANCGVGANVRIKHIRADGTVVSDHKYHNIVVDAGLTYLRALVGTDTGAGGALWINLSNNVAAPTSGETTLKATIYTADGLARAIGAYGTSGVNAYTSYKEFTNATAQHSVKSVGLSYTDSDATCMAGVAITEALLEVGDKLQITWTVTFSSV